MGVSYLTPHAHAIVGVDGSAGSIAATPILAGHTVAAFGGTCHTRDQFDQLDADRRRRSIQIDDALFLVGDAAPDAPGHIEHSCAPNCGLSGAVVVVALRDIAVGERLTFDHATSRGCDDDDTPCNCGAETCRGTVTGRDFLLPELQLRYRGHFSPYLARRISALVPAGAERRAFAW